MVTDRQHLVRMFVLVCRVAARLRNCPSVVAVEQYIV
jgi:hypothetical protein